MKSRYKWDYEVGVIWKAKTWIWKNLSNFVSILNAQHRVPKNYSISAAVEFTQILIKVSQGCLIETVIPRLFDQKFMYHRDYQLPSFKIHKYFNYTSQTHKSISNYQKRPCNCYLEGTSLLALLLLAFASNDPSNPDRNSIIDYFDWSIEKKLVLELWSIMIDPFNLLWLFIFFNQNNVEISQWNKNLKHNIIYIIGSF